jgi:hypothetical protein
MKTYWFGLARKFIFFPFLRNKIERGGGILLGDKAREYGRAFQ